MTLAILFSLKTMETLENGLQTHSEVSSQSCYSIDAEAWCKRALIHYFPPTKLREGNIFIGVCLSFSSGVQGVPSDHYP